MTYRLERPKGQFSEKYYYFKDGYFFDAVLLVKKPYGSEVWKYTVNLWFLSIILVYNEL